MTTFTKTCSFIGLDLEDTVHQTGQSAISTESTNQRSAFSRHFLTFDLMECSRMIWAQFSVETNNPAFSRHFLTFDLMIFFTRVQTPVTLNGELWSILVVRLAHSANLRSRFGHVSAARGVPGWSPIQVLTPLDGA